MSARHRSRSSRRDARRGADSPKGGTSRQEAFTLVKLLILVTVLNVVAAAVTPLWTQQIQREKEEELIFRGLQYAEAIRLFQTKVGRYPLQLEELLEIEPRSIRQLWKDPMTKDGKWGLVFAQGLQGGQGGQAGQGIALQQGSNSLGQQTTSGSSAGNTGGSQLGNSNSSRRSRRNEEETVTTGPITGVHSLSEEGSIKIWMGAEDYKSWIFTPDILPIAPTAPGEILPSLNSKWVGRPFPEGLEPTGGSGIDDAFGDGDEDLEDSPESRRENRKQRRNNSNRDRDGG